MGALLLGISTDPVDSHQRFRKAHALPFPLVADADKRVTTLYKVRRRFPPLTMRVTYLIDTSGTIQGVYNHEVAISKHIEEVLEGLQRLRGASN
jgi:peroxiredoxin Q/BCP